MLVGNIGGGGGLEVITYQEFEFYPGVALAARGGWALHRGQVV